MASDLARRCNRWRGSPAHSALKEAYCAALEASSWFVPRLRFAPNLEWLLIFTMPNSGSTALAKLLLTAKAAAALTERCEGEWLVPSLSNRKKRWDPSYRPSMRRVRARWMWRLRHLDTSMPHIVIEKSPANIVRADRLKEALKPMTIHSLVLVRDPYAVCESWHRRHGRSLANTSMPRIAEANSEFAYFRTLGEYWLERWRILARQRSSACATLRYEDFAEDPQRTISALARQVPLLGDVCATAGVEVKDYGVQRLRNMNEQQIAGLTASQIAALSAGLQSGREEIESLGYALR